MERDLADITNKLHKDILTGSCFIIVWYRKTCIERETYLALITKKISM